MSRVQPLPNYRSNIEGLNEQVQEIQDIVQNEKPRIQDMEIYSLKCEKMLQDNYKRYDPRARISKEDRQRQALRGDPNVAERERKEQEAHQWQLFMHTPTGHASAADHWRKTHEQFIQPLFKSSKYMDQDATNPYVVLTAGGPAEAASATLRPMPEFETKIQTLTQQVSDLKQVVHEWSQKTENLNHDYIKMNNILKFQQEHYGLPQPPPSNPQLPPSNPQPPSSNTFQQYSSNERQDWTQKQNLEYTRGYENAKTNGWRILPP